MTLKTKIEIGSYDGAFDKILTDTIDTGIKDRRYVKELVNIHNQAVDDYNELSAPGGAAKKYASFHLSTGGLTNQSNIARTVVINETSVNSDPLVFELLNNEVTIKKAGNFKIDFNCYFNNSSTARTEYTFWIELNNVEVPGSRSGNYQRGYSSGQESSISMILPIAADDVLKVVVNRTVGTATTGFQSNNGTRLTIEEK